MHQWYRLCNARDLHTFSIQCLRRNGSADNSSKPRRRIPATQAVPPVDCALILSIYGVTTIPQLPSFLAVVFQYTKASSIKTTFNFQVETRIMTESNETMASPAVSGLKLTFIMTGLCLAVLLTGMVCELLI
jgi:hypothetical protein